MWIFLSPLFQYFQMLYLDKNLLLLKLRSLIDIRNPVPAREYVNRNVEQVLILEDQFCPVGGVIYTK